MQKEIRVSAKTLEAALTEAASLLNIEKSTIEYEVISQTGGGFFSFLGKKVEILARAPGRPAQQQKKKESRRSPERETRRSEPAPRTEENAEVAELTPEQSRELVEDLRSFCAGICSQVAGEIVGVEADLQDDRLVLNIQNEYMAGQLQKNSKLAEALEHILRKKPRHLKRELPFRIFIDANDLRVKREQELIEMAHDLSNKVHENKRPIVLNYKSSYDRKIIHMALDKDDRVYTKSIGSGPNRKLMILPVKPTGADDASYSDN